MEQVGVVAEQLAGARGDRADDGDASEVRPQRQDPVVLDQDQRPAGEVAGDRRLVGAEVGQAGRGRELDVRSLEDPEPELHPQDARDGAVEQRFVDPPVGSSARRRGSP